MRPTRQIHANRQSALQLSWLRISALQTKPAMSDEKLIGHGVCPVCSNTKARFTVSKKSLACMTCNACNSQIFARSDSSDEKLRSFIKPAAAAPATATAPVIEPPAPKADPAPAPAAPTEKPKPAAPGWGFLGAFNG